MTFEINSFRTFVGILLLFTAICYGESEVQSICEDWAGITDGEYIFSNNVWGKEDIVESKQCLLTSGEEGELEHGWQWQWPEEEEARIKAYPEVIYGYKPWSLSSSTPNLPVKIANLKNLTVAYEVDTEATGNYNLMLDLWLTDSDTPSPNGIAHEVTIWLESYGITPRGALISKAFIGGQSYLRYLSSENNIKYTAFVSEVGQPKGTLDLKPFLDYLVRRGYINKNRYLATVELGNEIDSGEGTTWLRNFEITIK